MAWIIWFLIVQEAVGSKPAPLNAQVITDAGERLDLVDVQIKGFEPYAFEFYADGQTEFVSVFRVMRITRIKDANRYEVLFDTGETKIGQIKTFSLQAAGIIPPQNFDTLHLHHLERIQFISGEQLRSCPKGHFEEMTPYPHCPICGGLLDLGGFEENEDKPRALPQTHRLRLDPRNPSGGNARRW